MFSGVYWNQPVRPFVRPSDFVRNTSFCQSAGGGIKSHLVTALVKSIFLWVLNPLLDDKKLDWSKLEHIADNILKCIQNEK